MHTKNLVFFDLETTELVDAWICECAISINDGAVFSELIKPRKAISLKAMSINHIMPDMIENCPTFDKSESYNIIKSSIENIFVAHNAQFDIWVVWLHWLVIKKYICTKKIAEWLRDNEYRDFEDLSMQYLRYFYFHMMPEKRQWFDNSKINPHRWADDVLVLKKVFDCLCEDMLRVCKKIWLPNVEEISYDIVIEEMMDMSMRPHIMKKVRFGKYAWKEFAEVKKIDPQYLQWLYKSETQKQEIERSVDLVRTLEFYLWL